MTLLRIFSLVIAPFILASAFGQTPAPTGTENQARPTPSPDWPLYRHSGEQYRVYEFPGTGEPIPFRLSVPQNWTPGVQLPALITLRAGNSINNNHRFANDLVREANKRGYIVISPLGYRGYPQPYYGSPYPVDRPGGASTPAAGWSEQDDQRAEQDVLNVLALVTAEYNVDTSRVFLHGQNPSGSAAFHFAAKYPDLFRAIVVSSGPIITDNFPFSALQNKVAVMMLHGDEDVANTASASQRVTAELQKNGIEAEFHSVPGGKHLDAYLVYASEIFDFLDEH